MPCRTITLKARTDRRLVRTTSRSNRFVLAELVAPHAHTDGVRERPPVNLAFVLDRSGSMAGEKLALAKRAVEQSIGRLKESDRFSVVVYDDRIDVVAESMPATADARRRALSALATVDSRGSTNLAEGWLRGAEQVALQLEAKGVNRVLLLTDGLANQGITDPEVIARHAGELRLRGVSTTTFGVGADFDEHLLQQMATQGGGNFYLIANGAQIADFITSEVGEALDVVARDVMLEVTSPDGVTVESLSPFPFQRVGARTQVALGALVAEQLVQVVLRLNFPLGELGGETGVVVSVSDADGVGADGQASLDWRYASGPENDGQPRDVEMDRAVASAFAARARLEATRFNREGRFDEARQALRGVAKRVRSYAGRDAEMRALVAELERDAEELAVAMAPAALKEMHFASYTAARMRAPSGEAMRRSN